jgi:hypothetical protein
MNFEKAQVINVGFFGLCGLSLMILEIILDKPVDWYSIISIIKRAFRDEFIHCLVTEIANLSGLSKGCM